MASRPAVDNVLAFAARAKAQAARRLSPNTTTVINDCRDLALGRICDVVSKAFDRIEDELFEMAEKSADRELQNLYLDARAQAREKRTSIELAFRQNFLGGFDGKVRGEPARKAVASPLEGLSLVDDAALEESIAMATMATKMKSQSEDEFFALSQRLGFLLHDPELQDDANPMSPDTVCNALKEACGQINANYRVKLTILRLFEQHVAKDLASVYHDVNSRLVERHHILPDIRPTWRKPVASPQRVKPAPASRQTASGAEVGGDELFATLQQLMSGGLGARAGMPVGPTSLPSGFPQQSRSAEIATDRLLGNLSTLQVPAMDLHDMVAMARESADIASALNVLREVGAKGLANGASQVDSMTIDIVAMLFDYVFNDRQISAPIKALLAKLQIPVLKAALLDKRFFSQKSHPARSLLDALAELALEVGEDADAQHPVFAFIAALVERVYAEFDADIALFERELETARTFAQDREKCEESFVEQSARLVHERERREIARLVAESAVNERLSGRQLPPPVVVMLKVRWVDVLRAAYLESGEDSIAWNAACHTVDDLLWSLEPKAGPDHRKRLIGLLPGLLRSLQEGLTAIDVETHERERFFSSLVDHHALAVKAGLRQVEHGQVVSNLGLVEACEVEIPERAEESAVEPAPGAPGLMRIHLEGNGVRVEEIQLSATSRQAVFEAPASLPDNLKRGTWVEFNRGIAGLVRAKLSWISPHKGVMLFTNPESASAISLPPDAFLAQLRDGMVRIFAEEPLVDRAVDSVLCDLRAA